jgi:hypothetical protein
VSTGRSCAYHTAIDTRIKDADIDKIAPLLRRGPPHLGTALSPVVVSLTLISGCLTTLSAWVANAVQRRTVTLAAWWARSVLPPGQAGKSGPQPSGKRAMIISGIDGDESE